MKCDTHYMVGSKNLCKMRYTMHTRRWKPWWIEAYYAYRTEKTLLEQAILRTHGRRNHVEVRYVMLTRQWNSYTYWANNDWCSEKYYARPVHFIYAIHMAMTILAVFTTLSQLAYIICDCRSRWNARCLFAVRMSLESTKWYTIGADVLTPVHLGYFATGHFNP